MGAWSVQVLLLRRVINSRRKALLVLPFVAVVREKDNHLKGLLTSYNMRRSKHQRIKVKAFHGNKGGRGLGEAQSLFSACDVGGHATGAPARTHQVAIDLVFQVAARSGSARSRKPTPW